MKILNYIKGKEREEKIQREEYQTKLDSLSDGDTDGKVEDEGEVDEEEGNEDEEGMRELLNDEEEEMQELLKEDDEDKVDDNVGEGEAGSQWVVPVAP